MTLAGQARTSWASRLLGWLIIYAFALNTMLTAAVASQMAGGMAGDLSAICTDATSPSHTSPAGGSHADHQSCVICTTLSFAPPLPEAAALAAAPAVTAVLRPPAASAAPAQSRHTPRSSQGPPQTA